jgi:hypothetical protein
LIAGDSGLDALSLRRLRTAIEARELKVDVLGLESMRGVQRHGKTKGRSRVDDDPF